MKKLLLALLLISSTFSFPALAQQTKEEKAKLEAEQKKAADEQRKAQDEQRKANDELRKAKDEQRKAMDEQRKAAGEQRKAMSDQKKAQEIIIRRNADKEAQMTIVVNGDDITINGKPLSEFKDSDVTVNKRNIIIRNGKSNANITLRDFDTEDIFGGTTFWNKEDAEPRAFLGVTTEDVDGGARITDITKESAAEKAGLKAGDVITKLGDTKIDGPESLLDAVSDRKPKEEVTVYYKRDGKDSQVKTTLGERKQAGSVAYTFSSPDGISRSYTIPRVKGMKPMQRFETWGDSGALAYTLPPMNYNFNEPFDKLENFFPKQQRLGIKVQDIEEANGVKVLDVESDSPADKAGLKKDDIITEIGGKKVTNTDEAREYLHDNQEKATYNIKAKRNGNEVSFDIKIQKKLKTANL